MSSSQFTYSNTSSTQFVQLADVICFVSFSFYNAEASVFLPVRISSFTLVNVIMTKVAISAQLVLALSGQLLFFLVGNHLLLASSNNHTRHIVIILEFSFFLFNLNMYSVCSTWQIAVAVTTAVIKVTTFFTPSKCTTFFILSSTKIVNGSFSLIFMFIFHGYTMIPYFDKKQDNHNRLIYAYTKNTFFGTCLKQSHIPVVSLNLRVYIYPWPGQKHK